MKNYRFTGKGVGIAILDTGIYPHIDFDTRIRVFRDFLRGRTVPYDDNGHGTHVAGIAAGSGVGSDGRCMGAAPGAHLVVGKILDARGNGNLKDVLKAFLWIGENKDRYGVRIVNVSIGSAGIDTRNGPALVEGVEKLWDEGLVVVTAAGNMGPKPGSITAPGCSRKVITVGSSDLLDRYSGISGVGPTKEAVCKPDVVMPGDGILSCAPGNPPAYVEKKGTSMSTPQVSGAIARLLEKDPFLTNVEVKMLLKEAAVDLGYERNRQGWGLLDVEKLLRL